MDVRSRRSSESSWFPLYPLLRRHPAESYSFRLDVRCVVHRRTPGAHPRPKSQRLKPVHRTLPIHNKASVLWASPPPERPSLPLAGVRWARATPPTGLPMFPIPLLHACRRHYPGGTGRCSRRSLPDRCRPSPCYGRVGFRVTRFEACSAFIRVAARMVAESPCAAHLIGVHHKYAGFRYFYSTLCVPSMH